MQDNKNVDNKITKVDKTKVGDLEKLILPKTETCVENQRPDIIEQQANDNELMIDEQVIDEKKSPIREGKKKNKKNKKNQNKVDLHVVLGVDMCNA